MVGETGSGRRPPPGAHAPARATVRRRRPPGPGARTLAILATALAGSLPVPAAAAPTWGEPRTVAEFAWTDGRTAVAAGGALHVLYVTDLTPKGFARDGGPYQGVFHVSSTDGGRSWSTPLRVSQPDRHAFRPALASDGTTLVAAWLTQRSYERYDPAQPRVLFVRTGSGAAWGRVARLSPKRGRVDRPSTAASEGRVYVVWTDAGAGRVRLARSADGGETWRRAEVGRTKALDPLGEGFAGLPAVAASGSTVGVVWISSSRGEVRAKVSTDGGETFGEAVVLAPGGANGGVPAVAIATAISVRQVPPNLLRAGRTMGAKGWELQRTVVLPAAVPGYWTGLQQAWAVAWRALLAAELIRTGAARGLGHLLEASGRNAAMILAVMVVIVVIGLLIDYGFAAVDRRIRRGRGLVVAA